MLGVGDHFLDAAIFNAACHAFDLLRGLAQILRGDWHRGIKLPGSSLHRTRQRCNILRAEAALLIEGSLRLGRGVSGQFLGRVAEFRQLVLRGVSNVSGHGGSLGLKLAADFLGLAHHVLGGLT